MRILPLITALVLSAPALAQVAAPVQPSAPVAAQTSPKPDGSIFRHFIWGVSKEDVKSFEKAVFYKEDADSLSFVEPPESQNDYRRLITYQFRNGKLWRARYEYQDFAPPTSPEAADAFEKLRLKLNADYGVEGQDDYIWKVKSFYKYPQEWPNAMQRGEVTFRTVWTLRGSRVVLTLSGQSPYYFLSYTAEQTDVTETGGILGNLPDAQKTSP